MDNTEHLPAPALRLLTVAAGAPLEELNHLKAIIGTSRIVGMGEATHGSKEFTLVRHRMLRFLVEDMGFSGLVLEAPQEKAKAIDTYIKAGEGDPKQLLAELGYWVHNTQEMLSVIEWMRTYNKANSSEQLSFVGCDIAVDDERRHAEYSIRDEAMADICIDVLNELGADAKIALWSHNMHISYISDGITTQGQFLKDKIGDDYMAFVSLFNEGHFNAAGWDEASDKATGFKTFEVTKAPPDTYENAFARTGLPLAIFDLRSVEHKLSGEKVRSVGSVFDPQHPEGLEHQADLAKECDAVIWINQISASTPL